MGNSKLVVANLSCAELGTAQPQLVLRLKLAAAQKKLSTCVGTCAIGKLMQKKLSRVGVGGWVGGGWIRWK